MRGEILTRLLTLLLVMGCLALQALCEDDNNEMAHYVWQKTEDQLIASQIAGTGQVVVGVLIAEYIRFDKHRMIIRRDSVRARVLGRNGVLDSFVVQSGKAELLNGKRFSWPDLTHANFHASFFPNDTGDTILALNLDLDTTRSLRPIGIVNVNRITYRPVSAYLSLPVDDKIRRRSQIFHAVELDGAIYPAYYLEIIVERGVLSEEYFQLTVHIDSLAVQ